MYVAGGIGVCVCMCALGMYECMHALRVCGCMHALRVCGCMRARATITFCITVKV